MPKHERDSHKFTNKFKMKATITTQGNITITGEFRNGTSLIISVNTKQISASQATALMQLGASVTKLSNDLWHICVPKTQVLRYKIED